MKLSFFFFLLILLSNPNLAIARVCPQEIVVSIECAPQAMDFQLLSHIGRYSQPKIERDFNKDLMICTYLSNEWISKYKYIEGSQEITALATNLKELYGIVKVIDKKGFKVDHFSEKSNPFTMVAFNDKEENLKPEQMFLFSGLESTFENNNFNVGASDENKVSTIVINERYLKSQDVAADTFQTGSNCHIKIK